MTCKEVFADLGERVSAHWRQHGFRESMLPEIAAEELSREPLHNLMGWQDIIDWILHSEAVPYQQFFESPFGEPQITVYWHQRFFVQVLYWTSSTTSIHNHAFCGAFTVLSGSSLQCSYQFDCQNNLSDELRLGTLALTGTKLLQRGSVERLECGDAVIHSVFHLDSPSVTVVVRTHRASNPADRVEYYRPSVSFSPAVEDQQLTRRIQCLELLRRVDYEHYLKNVTELLRTADPSTSFAVLRRYYRDGRVPPADLKRLDDQISGRWPVLQGLLIPLFAEMRRQSMAIPLRRLLTTWNDRLVLGLILSQPTWGSVIAELAKHVFDQAPLELIRHTLKQLTSQGQTRPRYDLADALVERIAEASNNAVRILSEPSELRALMRSVLLAPLFGVASASPVDSPASMAS